MLSLDYLRAVAKDHKFDFLAAMQKRAGAIGQDTLAAAHTVIQSAQHEVAASGNMASARAIAMATRCAGTTTFAGTQPRAQRALHFVAVVRTSHAQRL